jgi:chromosome segregation ATPase
MTPRKIDDPAQLLTWLDENQREDRRELAELRQLNEAQARALEDVVLRFKDLEQAIGRTQSELGRFTEIEDGLEAVKNELLTVVEERTSRLQQTDSQLKSGLQTQSGRLVHLTKAIESLQDSITALDNQVDTLPPRLETQAEQVAELGRDIEALEARSTEVHGRILRLNEQLSDQTEAAGGLARRLERLEGRLSNTRAQLGKFPQIETALQKTRDELVLMIREVDEAWKKHTREAAKMRNAEHKDLRIGLDMIEKRLAPIPQLEERLKALPPEDQRLRDLISQQEQRIPPLYKAIEELRDRIAYVEEDRPQIFRRIDELEAQMPGIYQTHSETARQIQFLQEWTQRTAGKIDELRRFEDQLEKWRTDFEEGILQGEQRRDRRLSDWEQALKEYAEHIVGWRERLRRYEIAHQENRRAVGQIDVIAEELRRDQAEVAEQQRLADERLQRELAAWQVENDKRWRLFLKQRDYDWDEQVKVDSQQSQRLDEIEETVAVHLAAFPGELERLDENDRRIFSRIASLLEYLDASLEERMAERRAQRERLQAQFTSVDDVITEREPPARVTRATGTPRAEE